MYFFSNVKLQESNKNIIRKSHQEDRLNRRRINQACRQVDELKKNRKYNVEIIRMYEPYEIYGKNKRPNL